MKAGLQSTKRPRVFFSYRRRDTAGETGRLYDNCVARRPTWEVFLDVDFIPAGRDFIAEIDRFLSACGVVVVMIGSHWLRSDGPSSVSPSVRPVDIVHLELERAHDLGVAIMPVLVNEASMPAAADLPASLSWLTHLNAARLRHESFEQDLVRFLSSADGILAAITGSSPRAEVIERTRRRRTLQLSMRGGPVLLSFETKHIGFDAININGAAINITGAATKASGAAIEWREVKRFGSRLTFNVTFEGTLPDGARQATAQLQVRYSDYSLWLIGLRLVVDGDVLYEEGRLLD